MKYAYLIFSFLLFASCSESDVDEGRLEFTTYVIDNQSSVDLYYENNINNAILINAGETIIIEILFVQVGSNFAGSTIISPLDHYTSENPFEVFEDISQSANFIVAGDLIYSQNPVDESLWILDADTRTYTITITDELID